MSTGLARAIKKVKPQEDFGSSNIAEDDFHTPRVTEIQIIRTSVRMKRGRVVVEPQPESHEALWVRVKKILENDLHGPKL